MPEGKSVVGWQSSHSGSIVLELADSAGSGSASGSTNLLGYGSGATESMSLTYDELGLTDEERATFDDAGGLNGRVLVYASDGSTVELATEYEGWAWSGVATDEGFVLMVNGPQQTIITSPDGRVWTEQPALGNGFSAGTAAAGGTIWQMGSDGFGSFSIRSGGYGETPTTAAREISGGEGFGVVFEDPGTGDDLVAFTDEDLAPIFMPASDGSTAPLTLEEFEPPSIWVGWSAEGTAWGWQLMADAFGIDDGEPWAEFAVGGDFVLARVQVIEVPQILGSADGQTEIATTVGSDSSGSASSAGGQAGIAWGTSGDLQPPRWFIARVP